ncbi:hypothetical protein V8G54_017366 [Vigna mungo]|uniref:SWIM-type domain-containing protein n=1 Tax=Vigna mungo TaxID=3915 RepID=A0AAQ3NMV6_VIGMU
MDEERKIVVHHGGNFVSDDNGRYFGIVASVKEVGHMDVNELWYSLGGQSVDPDSSSVCGNMMEPEIIEMIDWVGGHLDDEGDMQHKCRGDGEVNTELGIEMVEGEGDAHEGDGEGEGDAHEGDDEGEGDAHEGDDEGEGDAHEGDGEVNTKLGTEMVEGEGDAHEGDDEVHIELGTKMVEGEGEGDAHEGTSEDDEVHQVEDGEVYHVEEVEVHEVHDFELEDEVVEDSEGEDVHEAETEDEDVDDEEVDVTEESLIDVNVHPVLESSRSTDKNLHDVRGLSDNDGSESEDDDGSTKIRFPTFSMPKSLEAYKWEVGTYFAEEKEFTYAIRTYALSNGRNLKFIKNDKKRISVKCLGGKGKCKWYAYCSFKSDVNACQLRKVFDTHSCNRDFNIKLMTSKWLSQRIEKTVRENPTMKVTDIREKVTRKWNVAISRNMAFKARAMAKDNVEGSFNEQFRRLYDYGHELLKTNPGKYGGQLLTAVGRDGNDQMLPIANVVVEVENKESWTWFLEHLIEDLGGEAVCVGCTFISDQQKQFVVNVDTMDCACRKWTITDIPCSHAITAMKFLNINAEDYIGHWFRKSTYEETYNTIINPINGQHIWDVTPYSDILPPKKRTMPGRPKKKRRLKVGS